MYRMRRRFIVRFRKFWNRLRGRRSCIGCGRWNPYRLQSICDRCRDENIGRLMQQFREEHSGE